MSSIASSKRALSLASLFAAGLVFFRIFYFKGAVLTDFVNLRQNPDLLFLFLLWNLLLAWVPLGIGGLLEQRSPPKIIWLLGLGCWILFFPNAPYLLTDLIHLRPRPDVPLWYDALMLFWFAQLGCWLAIRAMQQLELPLDQLFGRTFRLSFLSVTILLSGLGIYLGRIQRWNSWDLLLHPTGVLGDVWQLLTTPLIMTEAWLMVIFMTLMMGSGYWLLVGKRQ